MTLAPGLGVFGAAGDAARAPLENNLGCAERLAVGALRLVTDPGLMMDSVSGDSWVEHRRRDYVVDPIETVPTTAERYEQAVSALATLIVELATSCRRDNSVKPGMASGYSDID